MITGRLDVDQLLDELTPQQVNRWRAFFRLLLDWWDTQQQRGDLRFGLLATWLEPLLRWAGGELTCHPRDFLQSGRQQVSQDEPGESNESEAEVAAMAMKAYCQRKNQTLR